MKLKIKHTHKDGFCLVGPGADGQSSINTVYNARFLPDNQMNARRGYAIEGGIARLVHVVSATTDEEDSSEGEVGEMGFSLNDPTLC